MKLKPLIDKQPRERLSVTVEFSGALDEGDFIVAIDELSVYPSGLVVAANDLVAGAQTVHLWFEGGDNGVTYVVTLRARTMQVIPAALTPPAGELLEEEITVRVKEI
jgi:hypothetical protein